LSSEFNLIVAKIGAVLKEGKIQKRLAKKEEGEDQTISA
jgi:hypothetical protein